MNKYTGNSCPVCGKIFTDEDDVVVCPECGAPHHRDCYRDLGSCAFQSRHAQDFNWQGPQRRETPHAHAPHGDAAPVMPPPQREASAPPPDYSRNYGANEANQPPQPFELPQNAPEPMRIRLEDEIDGISVKDYAQFIGPNAFYYLIRFKMMATTGHTVLINFSAFVFGFFYYFNRKMYKYGAIMLSLFLLAVIPFFVFAYLLAPVVIPQIPDFLAGITPQITPTPLITLLATIFQYTLMLYFTACCLSGLFANQLYYRHARRTVSALQQQYAGRPDQELSHALAIRGRTNSIAVLMLLGAFFIAYLAFNAFIQYQFGGLLPY